MSELDDLADRVFSTGKTRMSMAAIRQILLFNEEGHPVNRIAGQVGVHHSVVKRVLDIADVPRNPRDPIEPKPRANPDPPARGGTEPSWRADWSGDQGTIQTGVVTDEFDPHNFDEVLTRLGYTPGEIRMEIVSASRWEQSRAVLDEDGKKTGESTTTWLNAYRYKAQKGVLCVDLPALYAEVKESRPSGIQRGPTGRTAVVVFGDVQCGKVDHLGGLKELLERLQDKRDALTGYLESANVESVLVADVGDIVEGFENVSSQVRTNALSLMDQVDVAATELWKTIRVCEGFGPVDVLSVPSNHCQWRKGKGLVGRPGDDWGLHISQRLERVNEEAGLNVNFHRPGDWDETLTFEVQNTVLGMAHGHQASRPDGVKTWWEKMTHGGVLDCHVLLTGHFHFPSLRPHGRDSLTGKARWHIQASTLDNGSSWVRNKFGEDGDPALTVFVIDRDLGFDVQSFALL